MFVMEVVSGGLIETTDRFLYRAPESGYQPRYELIMSPFNQGWSDQVEKKFYIRSREGKVFVSMEISIYSNQSDTSLIELKYLANPAGSRNLEYDPNKSMDPERIRKVGLEKVLEEGRAKSK